MTDTQLINFEELDSKLGEAVHLLVCCKEGLNPEDYVLSQVLNLYPSKIDVELGVRAYKAIRYIGVLPDVAAADDTKSMLSKISTVRNLGYKMTYVYVICNLLLTRVEAKGMSAVSRQLNSVMSKLATYNNSVEGRMLNIASCMNMLPEIYEALRPANGAPLRLQHEAIDSISQLVPLAEWYGGLIHWYGQHEKDLAGLV